MARGTQTRALQHKSLLLFKRNYHKKGDRGERVGPNVQAHSERTAGEEDSSSQACLSSRKDEYNLTVLRVCRLPVSHGTGYLPNERLQAQDIAPACQQLGSVAPHPESAGLEFQARAMSHLPSFSTAGFCTHSG